MSDIWNIIGQHISTFWDWLLGFFLFIVGFLVSKKALLATIYYVWGLSSKIKKYFYSLFHSQHRKYKREPYWSSEELLHYALGEEQKIKEREFYSWLTYMREKNILTEEQLTRIPLYSIFIQYVQLNTLQEKQEFADILKKELQEAQVHAHNIILGKEKSNTQ